MEPTTLPVWWPTGLMLTAPTGLSWEVPELDHPLASKILPSQECSHLHPTPPYPTSIPTLTHPSFPWHSLLVLDGKIQGLDPRTGERPSCLLPFSLCPLLSSLPLPPSSQQVLLPGYGCPCPHWTLGTQRSTEADQKTPVYSLQVSAARPSAGPGGPMPGLSSATSSGLSPTHPHG